MVSFWDECLLARVGLQQPEKCTQEEACKPDQEGFKLSHKEKGDDCMINVTLTAGKGTAPNTTV